MSEARRRVRIRTRAKQTSTEHVPCHVSMQPLPAASPRRLRAMRGAAAALCFALLAWRASCAAPPFDADGDDGAGRRAPPAAQAGLCVAALTRPPLPRSAGVLRGQCDRAASRHARAVLQQARPARHATALAHARGDASLALSVACFAQFVLPLAKRARVVPAAACPWRPERDAFAEHERHKQRLNERHWRVRRIAGPNADRARRSAAARVVRSPLTPLTPPPCAERVFQQGVLQRSGYRRAHGATAHGQDSAGTRCGSALLSQSPNRKRRCVVETALCRRLTCAWLTPATCCSAAPTPPRWRPRRATRRRRRRWRAARLRGWSGRSTAARRAPPAPAHSWAALTHTRAPMLVLLLLLLFAGDSGHVLPARRGGRPRARAQRCVTWHGMAGGAGAAVLMRPARAFAAQRGCAPRTARCSPAQMRPACSRACGPAPRRGARCGRWPSRCSPLACWSTTVRRPISTANSVAPSTLLFSPANS